MEGDEKNQVGEDLIIRLLQGCATDEEKKKIREWRREGAENEAEFRTLVRLWSLTGAAQPSTAQVRLPDADALIRRAVVVPVDDPPGRLEAAGRSQRSPAGLPSLTPDPWSVTALLKVAAVGLLFIPLGFGVGWLAGVADRAAFVPPEHDVITGDGEMVTIALEDGSSIRLGPHSRLSLREDAKSSTVRLDGRAFFGIVPSPSRHFVVHTPHGEATVLGTRFEVRSEDAELRVLVVEGSVQVSSGGGVAEVRAGEMSHARSGGAPGISAVEDVYVELAWMGNALVFQSTPLDLAIREIELRYGVQIILETPSLASLTVTATLNNLSVHDVALILCEIIGARCSIDTDTIRMERDVPGGMDSASGLQSPGSAN